MNQLREAVFRRKEKLIKKLITRGVYKKGDKHLYELTLSEIESEYEDEMRMQ